jgi:hypothetical protein
MRKLGIVCGIFHVNALTLTCAYCMLTKGVNGRVFKDITVLTYYIIYLLPSADSLK